MITKDQAEKLKEGDFVYHVVLHECDFLGSFYYLKRRAFQPIFRFMYMNDPKTFLTADEAFDYLESL